MNSKLYITFKIKSKTAIDFRRYSRQLGQQQSETLQLMLDFFRDNGISPNEDLGPKMITLEKRIKTRINAVVAILKDIEKTQTKPTHSMLQVLFSESPVKKKEILKEKNRQHITDNLHLHREISVHTTMENELRKKLSERTSDLKTILDKVRIVRNNFGIAHLRLNMSREEFENLKQKSKTLV